MKLLVITAVIGRSPAGKVAETIIIGLLKKGHELLIYCSENSSSDPSIIKATTIPFYYSLPDKLAKFLHVLFFTSLKYKYWEYFVYSRFLGQIETFDPDIIYSVAANGKEAVLNLGLKISKKLKKPFTIHLMDPIPSPKGWETHEIYRKSRIYAIKKTLRDADLLSMGNPQMLEFQQNNLRFDILKKSFIVPDPLSDISYSLGEPPKKNILTYLGTFYSARKPDSLLLGFSEFHQYDSKAELHIVGKNHLNLDKFELPDSVKEKIFFHGWTADLKPIYENSSVLIDVDANIPGDVYISSKLKGYLLQKRVIILISRNDSPSSKLLSAVKESIIITDYNSRNISSAIQKAVLLKNRTEIFADRNYLLNYLDSNRIADEITERFLQVIQRRNPCNELI